MSGPRPSTRSTRSRANGDVTNLPIASVGSALGKASSSESTSTSPSPSPAVGADVKIKGREPIGLRARRRSTVDEQVGSASPAAGMSSSSSGPTTTVKEKRQVVEVVIPAHDRASLMSPVKVDGRIGSGGEIDAGVGDCVEAVAVAGPGPRSMSLRGGGGRRASVSGLHATVVESVPVAGAGSGSATVATRSSARFREQEQGRASMVKGELGSKVILAQEDGKNEKKVKHEIPSSASQVGSGIAGPSRIKAEPQQEKQDQPERVRKGRGWRKGWGKSDTKTKITTETRSETASRSASVAASISAGSGTTNLEVEEQTGVREKQSSSTQDPVTPAPITENMMIQTSPTAQSAPTAAYPMSTTSERQCDTTFLSKPAPSVSARPSRQRVERARAKITSQRTIQEGSTEPASPTSHSLRSTKGQNPCIIPFPPADVIEPDHGGIITVDEDEEENGQIVQDDMKDDKLMAVCAALETFGNRALTPTEIGDICVNQGWIRPSPALAPQSLVQSAIRAYARRCAVHQPERIMLIRKRILAGYAMESRLLPALHPSAARDGHRRKGTVYYLEGRVGGRVWTSPFDDLPEDQESASAMNVVKQTSHTQVKRNGSGRQAKQVRASSTSATEDAMDVVAQDDTNPVKPTGLKIKIKLGGMVSAVAETAPTGQSADANPETMMDTPSEYEITSDDGLGSESIDEDEGDDQDNGMSRTSTDDDSEEDSEESDDPRDENGLPMTGSIKDLARSFFMDSPPMVPVADSPIAQVRFSPFEPIMEPAFPNNPLDGMFEDSDYMPALSPPDAQSGSSSEDEDEVATEFMDTLDLDRLGYRKTSIKRVGFHTMAYRDVLSPGDAEGSEIDTPATTPRTCYDEDDEAEHKKAFMAPVSGMGSDEVLDVDEELQNAVHVLGQLLPDLSDSIDQSTEISTTRQELQGVGTRAEHGDTVMTSATAPVTQASSSQAIPSVRPRRKSSVGARDFMRLSLPLPACPAPSPLNSPTFADRAGSSTESSREYPLGQSDPECGGSPTDGENIAGTSDLELLPDLGRQLAISDCESACICSLETDANLAMDVDSAHTPRDAMLIYQGGDELDQDVDLSNEHLSRSWADLLGPESVGMEELDNVWGFMNAAVTAAAVDQGKRRRRGEPDCQSIASTKSDSSDRTLQQKDVWGIIGVGSTLDTSSRARRIEKARFARALIRAKAIASSNPSGSPSKCSGGERQDHQIPDDAIGMEDVADAILSAWADGETILEDVSEPSNTEFANRDEEHLLGASFQYSDLDDHAMGVSPSVLTKSTDPDGMQEAVLRGDGDVRTPSGVGVDPGSSDIQDAAAVTVKAKMDTVGGTEATPGASTSAPLAKLASAPPLQTQTGSSTTYAKLPARLPAPPRPAASTPTFVNASKPTYPPVQALLIDSVSVFAISWNETLIYRRIESDYVNFSALLRALKHPSVMEVERRVGQHATSMIFRDSKFAGVDGVWLPLDVAEAEAATIQVPSSLASALFQEDMAGLFPEPLAKIKTILGAQGDAPVQRNAVFKGGRYFGILFGCMGDSLTKDNQNTTLTLSLPLPLADPTISSHDSPLIPSKRLNTVTTASNSDGPPSKRRKPSISTGSDRRLTRAQKHNS